MKRTYYRLLPFQSLTIYFKCANSTLTQNASIKDNFDKGAFKYSVSAFYYATQHLTLYVCLSVCPNFFYIIEEVIEVDEPHSVMCAGSSEIFVDVDLGRD